MLSLGAALLFLLIASLTLRWIHQSAHDNAQAIAAMEAEITATTLAVELKGAELMARTIAQMSPSNILSQQEFSIRVDALVQMIEAGVVLQWAPQAVVRYVHPSAGNEAVIGLDLRRDPGSRDIIAETIQSGKARWDGPLALRQGGTGMIFRYPVYRDNAPASEEAFSGLATSLVNLDLMMQVLSRRSHGHGLRVWISGSDGVRKPVWVSTNWSSAVNEPTATAQIDFEFSDASHRENTLLTIEVEAQAQGFVSSQQSAARVVVLVISATLLGLMVFAFTSQRAIRREISVAHQALESLFDETSDLIQSVDRDGQLMYANRAWLETLGYDESTLGSLNLFSIIAPEERDDCRKTFERLKRGERVGLIAVRMLASDGRVVSLEGNISVRREYGETLMLRGIFRDVTARRAAEAIQQAMLDNETAAIVRVRDRHIIWANRAFELMMGYDPGEMNGMHTRDNYPDETSYAAFGAACYPVLLAGGTYRAEVEHRRKDGSPIYLDIAGHVLEDNPGETLWTMIDITERRHAQERVQALSETKLAQSEDRLRRMVVLSSSWYWETDADLRFTVLGDAGDESTLASLPLKGFRSMTLGRRRWEIEGVDLASGTWDEHRAQMTSRQTFQNFEYTVTRDGQKRWVRVSGEPIIDADGKFMGYRGVGRDVTAERLGEMKLRAMQATELIGQLTGGLAHDFRNMLNVVLGNLDQLDEEISADAKREHRMIATARSAALKGVGVTDSLLAVARRQPLQLSRHDLNDQLREMEALIKTAVGGAVLVELDLFKEPLQVRIDPAGLSNVVLNLAIKARDAMQEQTSQRVLILRSRKVSVSNTPPSPVKGLAAGTYAVIEVADTGPGMSPEVLAKVFEPFFTTKPVGKGTGLGLAMVHGFAEQLGGKADIESHLGTGTTICVYLPLIP
jgi:PAS domain S-box-containing protein